MHVNDILNFTSKQPMCIATAQCQLVATDSLILSNSIQVVKVNSATALAVKSRNQSQFKFS